MLLLFACYSWKKATGLRRLVEIDKGNYNVIFSNMYNNDTKSDKTKKSSEGKKIKMYVNVGRSRVCVMIDEKKCFIEEVSAQQRLLLLFCDLTI